MANLLISDNEERVEDVKTQSKELESEQPTQQETEPLKSFVEDVWTIRDSIDGVFVVGATGSGKTSGSSEAIVRAYLEESGLLHKTRESGTHQECKC